MSDTYEHWQEKCHCGQIIGDVGRTFRSMVVSGGMKPYEAAKSLGYIKMCCLNALQTPMISDVRTAHTGYVSEKILNPTEPIQVFSIKKLKALEGEESSIGDISTREEKKEEKKEEVRNIYSSIEGITEPKSSKSLKMNQLQRGDTIVTGYRRDENGQPVMINVGSGYHVPVLKFMIRTSFNRPAGYYDKDIDF